MDACERGVGIRAHVDVHNIILDNGRQKQVFVYIFHSVINSSID